VKPSEIVGAFVYRCYDDQGRLLYIGSSCNMARRLAEHADKSPWWSYCADIKTDAQDSLPKARLLEIRLIQRMHPIFNTNYRAGASEISERDYLAEKQPQERADLWAEMCDAMNSLTAPAPS